ncbi:hypothetical protein M408DRAFT_135777 [Serendipita vermifera MAFF 305830]|uniref:Uncharacterized protein n=1 Tax=Serendipita vermifera MAFF 305830 TaxID=933852 RepID=A0A0C2WS96_SERVB|nr:hypothetical protein M408DRAFT_135777 [Serendipita vermifera MAFF 305830]
MRLGAVGGVVLFPVWSLFNLITNCIFPTPENGESQMSCSTVLKSLVELCKTTAFGAAAGVVGATILRNRGHEFILDPEHAMRAGALGGAVLGPGMIIGLILFTIVYTRFSENRGN